MQMGFDIAADHEADARRQARLLSPPVAWPTIGLTVLVIAAHMTMLGVALAGIVPVWAVTLPLAITAYFHYTTMHEAIHRNIAPGWRLFGRINDGLGWWGSVILGSTWPLFRRTHISHHSHTNTDRDADAFAQGSLGRLFGIWAVAVFANLIPVKPLKWAFDKVGLDTGYLDAAALMPAREWRQHLWVHAGLCAFVWGGVLLGHGEAMFALYVLPASIGRLLLGIFLVWLPHQPFDHEDRYLNTRIVRFPFSRLLMSGHDYHLIHHLHPSVPVYNYPRLFRVMEPHLRAMGSRID